MKKKCPNCKGELEQLGKNIFDCEPCKEMFELSDGNLKTVSDKKSVFAKISENLSGHSKRVKAVADKYGIETDDDEGFFFG